MSVPSSAPLPAGALSSAITRRRTFLRKLLGAAGAAGAVVAFEQRASASQLCPSQHYCWPDFSCVNPFECSGRFDTCYPCHASYL